VECLKCGFANPEQARFCAGCGLAFATIECQHCKTENSPGSRFCNSCGQSLADKPPKKILRSAHSERRILTVLFSDLVDSTRLVDNLDPELSREIIRDFQRICEGVIEQNGGRVSTYLGDGIVALFSRHESNAERAINTALHINREIEQTRGSFSRSNQKIQVRSGIATGLAVVGDAMPGDSRMHQETAIGLPLNMAARIQGLAEPGGVAIGSATHQMTSELFEFENIGHHLLKGIKDSQQVWRVIAEKSISARFVAHAARKTPMVDRTEILQKLHACWDKSINTDGEVVVFTGEPGVGKSRITQQLTDTISSERQYYDLEYQCSPNHTNTALYPVISHLKATAGIERGESTAVQIDKLQLLIRESSDDFERDMPAFLELLSLNAEDKWPCPDLDPDEKKEWIFSVLITNMFSLSKINPLLITFEDVHWIDPTTLELLSRIVDSLEGYAILFLITSRPGFAPEFLKLPYVTALEVERLPQEYAQQLVDQVKGDNNLPAEILDEIVRRTEGNPLFIEEFSKDLLESMSPEELNNQLDGHEKLILPATVQESLLARIDRLPEASRDVALLAAVIGRDFSYDLLESVADYQGKNLYQDLAPLLNAQLVLQRKAPPNAEYSFKHALVRDVAYETLLKSDLIDIHKRIAQAIVSDFPEITSNSPELVARHFSEGNDYPNAVQYWLQAGVKASRQFALLEARTHLETGLKCLEKCQEDEQKKTIRLEFLITLGPVLMALEGSGSAITRKNYSEAVKLCDELPASAAQFKALWGQWNVSMDYNRDQGLVWADKLQKLAETLDSPDLKLQAHHCQWTTRFHYANHLDAQNHLNEGLALYDVKRHRHHAGVYGGHDPKVCGLCFLSWVHWFLGELNEAEEIAQNSLAYAERLDHAGSKLHVIELSLLLSQYQNNSETTQKLTDKLSHICETIGLPEYEGKLNCCKGIVMTNRGDLDEGIELIKKGLKQLIEVGTTEDVPVYTEYLAKALGLAKRPDEALKYLDDLLDSLEAQKLRYWQAELLRRKGILLSDKGAEEQALVFLQKSMQTANEQSALALALRSGLSLYRYNLKTGLFPQSMDELKDAYERFSEGQSSPELDEARLILGI